MVSQVSRPLADINVSIMYVHVREGSFGTYCIRPGTRTPGRRSLDLDDTFNFAHDPGIPCTETSEDAQRKWVNRICLVSAYDMTARLRDRTLDVGVNGERLLSKVR